MFSKALLVAVAALILNPAFQASVLGLKVNSCNMSTPRDSYENCLKNSIQSVISALATDSTIRVSNEDQSLKSLYLQRKFDLEIDTTAYTVKKYLKHSTYNQLKTEFQLHSIVVHGLENMNLLEISHTSTNIKSPRYMDIYAFSATFTSESNVEISGRYTSNSRYDFGNGLFRLILVKPTLVVKSVTIEPYIQSKLLFYRLVCNICSFESSEEHVKMSEASPGRTSDKEILNDLGEPLDKKGVEILKTNLLEELKKEILDMCNEILKLVPSQI